MDKVERTSILFVCMGNICRSPLAEGLFRYKANRDDVASRFEIDSAGTGGWHVGELPDPRMRSVAEKHGVTLTSRARQVHREDFRRFDLIVCMDADNRGHLLDMGAPTDKVSLLLEYDPRGRLRDVPDPYYGGAEGFDQVFRLVDAACEALLAKLTAASR